MANQDLHWTVDHAFLKGLKFQEKRLDKLEKADLLELINIIQSAGRLALASLIRRMFHAKRTILKAKILECLRGLKIRLCSDLSDTTSKPK